MVTLTLPKNEISWVSYNKDGITEYRATSNKDRSRYFLYFVDGNKLIKIGTGATPEKFESIRLKHIEESREKIKS